MKVFVAGATGVIGRRVIRRLVEQGYDVIGLARNDEKAKHVEALGAQPVIADALDRHALNEVIVSTAPNVIVHQLTSHGGMADFKRMDATFHMTNRLRTEAVETMWTAAKAVGTHRLILQSFCGLTFPRHGDWIKDETAPYDPNPPAAFKNTVAALKYLEGLCTPDLSSAHPPQPDRAPSLRHDTPSHREGTDTVTCIALRYGYLYGPGTAIAPEGDMARMIAKRHFPVVGGGRGVWSFIHVDDAAQATVLAVTAGQPGVYNVVDNDPAPVADWLPALAQMMGARTPRRVPAWLAKPVLGDGGVAIMTAARGGANAKAKRDLGWLPAFPDWREGFAHTFQARGASRGASSGASRDASIARRIP